MIGRTTLLALLTLALGNRALADDNPQPSNAMEREVQELETKFESAVIKGDTAFFGQVLAKDFMHTSQSGKFRNRDEWLANHIAGQSNYDALNVDELAIRIYGETAIVTGCLRPQGRTSQGKPIEGRYRFMRVWVKQSGAWQIAAFQSTRIASPEKENRP